MDGEVSDGENKELLIGAIVEIPKYNIAVLTDSVGYYKIEIPCVDSIEIKVNYEGYKEFSSTINIKNQKHFDVLLHDIYCEMQSVQIQHFKENNSYKSYERILFEHINKNAHKSIGELLKSSVGVDAIQVGNQIYKPTIQGNTGNRIVYIQNEARIEGQNWGNDHAPEINTLLSQNLVVVKSALALQYGQEAQAGAIICEPLKLINKKLAYTYLSGFQNNGKLYSNALRLQLKSNNSKLFSNIAFSQKRGGNIQTPSTYLDNTGIEEYFIGTNNSYNYKNIEIKVGVSYLTQKIGIYRGAHIGNIIDLIKNLQGKGYINTDTFSYHLERSYQKVDHKNLYLNIERNINKKFKLSILNNFQVNHRQEYDIHRPKNDKQNKANVDYLLNTFQQKSILEYKRSARCTYMFGYQYMNQSNVVQTTDIVSLIPNYKLNNIGIYAIQNIELNKTHIDFGLRYDIRKNQVFYYDQSVLLRPSHIYQTINSSYNIEHILHKNLKFILSGSYTQRPPAINEEFGNGLHHGESIYIVNNKSVFSFKNETSLNHNFSLDFDNAKFKIITNAYLNKSHNYIYLVPTAPIITIRGAFPTFEYQQGAVVASGMDVFGSYRYKKWKTILKSSINYSKKQSDNDFLLLTPAPKASVQQEYEMGRYKSFISNVLSVEYVNVFKQPFFPKKSYFLSYNTNSGSEIYTFQGDYISAPKTYGLVNVGYTTKIKLKTHQLEVYAHVDNLLNKNYKNYLNMFKYYTSEMGRNIGVNLIFSY
ncbi:MAG: carboxypeptidase-like regulatory domain-containing protein [Cytophagales bacterium]